MNSEDGEMSRDRHNTPTFPSPNHTLLSRDAQKGAQPPSFLKVTSIFYLKNWLSNWPDISFNKRNVINHMDSHNIGIIISWVTY